MLTLTHHSRLVPWVLSVLGVFSGAGCHHHKEADDADMSVGDMPVHLSLDAACAVGGAKAEVKRLNLVVIYDRSGSMGAPGEGDPNLKWLPVGEGLKGFFNDPASVGVSSTLQFFPPTQNPDDQCNSGEYIAPVVPLTALPSASFGTAIDATSPEGQTPTVPAMQGSITVAQQIAAADSTAKVAIVLVTDGEPDICDSSVNLVAQAAAMVATTIPTFVIGIGAEMVDGGEDLTGLEQISQAGGTGKPVFVSVGNEAQTTADFTAALDAIRVQQVPCSFPIPAPPSGEAINYKQVNVLYTPSNQATQTLMYSSGCASGDGWDYDNVENPTVINLCTTTCQAAQVDRGAQVEILFGCQTDGMIQ